MDLGSTSLVSNKGNIHDIMADSSILPRCHIVNLEHSLVFLALFPAFNIVLSYPISDYTE